MNVRLTFLFSFFARRAGSGSGASQIPFWSALDLFLLPAGSQTLSHNKMVKKINEEAGQSNYSSPLDYLTNQSDSRTQLQIRIVRFISIDSCPKRPVFCHRN